MQTTAAWTSTRSCGTCRTGIRSCWSIASRRLEPGKSIRGIKNVTMNEPYFAGHFPDYPVMPAVLVIEALAQLASILAWKMSGRTPGDGTIIFFAGIDNARFRRQVRPGRPAGARVRSAAARARRRQVRRARQGRRRDRRGGESAGRDAHAGHRPKRQLSGALSRDAAHPSDGARRSEGGARRRRRGRRLFDRRPARAGRTRARVIGPHVVLTGRTSARRAQPAVPVHVDRRDPAGPQVRRRADDDDDRRRQRLSRVHDDQRRHRAGPRRHARSATATCSSPTRTSRTIASSATARRSRTMRSSPATCTSTTGS